MIKRKIAKSGFPGVYKNARGNLWRFDSYESSDPLKKGRVIVTGFKSADDAYQAKLSYEARVKEEMIKRYNDSRFGYLVDKYIEYKAKHVKITTLEHTKSIIRKYFFKYKEYSISKFIDNDNISNFLNGLISQNFSTLHKNRVLMVLRNIFDLGFRINYITQIELNIIYLNTEPIKKNNEIKEKKENYWELSEWRKFINKIDSNNKWYLFFLVFAELGCRLGEIRGLQVKHINIKTCSLMIRQQVTNNNGSGHSIITSPKTISSIRNVGISKSTMYKIIKYLEVNESIDHPNDFIFFARRVPISTSSIRRAFDYYQKLAKVHRITIHGIRHSHVFWALGEKGASIQTVKNVSERVGHSDIRVTLNIYEHISKKKDACIKKCLEKISNCKK